MDAVGRPAGARSIDQLLAQVRSRIDRLGPVEAWQQVLAAALLVDTRRSGTAA